MVRILHTSDWHVGRTIRGISRADEHRRVLDEMVQIAADRRVELVVVSGDLFDHAAPGPEAEQIVYHALLGLAEVAPVLIVAGNHDNPRRLQAVAPLLELGRVQVAATIRRPEDGGVVWFPEQGIKVAVVPWVSRRGIVTAEDLFVKDPDDHSADYAGRLRAVIRALCAGFGVDTVNLLAGHLTVHGAEPSGSERAVHTVFEYGVPSSAFPESLSYAALGHFHRRQRVPAPGQVWYSGSPLQLDFGEAGEDKGVMVVEAEPGLPAEVIPVPLSGGKRLEVVRGTLEQVVAAAERLGDAYVKVELEEPSRVGLADEVRKRIPGTVDVVLTKSTVGHRDTPDRVGRPPAELFAEYLKTRGVEDVRLVGLFNRLMEEVHEA